MSAGTKFLLLFELNKKGTKLFLRSSILPKFKKKLLEILKHFSKTSQVHENDFAKIKKNYCQGACMEFSSQNCVRNMTKNSCIDATKLFLQMQKET